MNVFLLLALAPFMLPILVSVIVDVSLTRHYQAVATKNKKLLSPRFLTVKTACQEVGITQNLSQSSLGDVAKFTYGFPDEHVWCLFLGFAGQWLSLVLCTWYFTIIWSGEVYANPAFLYQPDIPTKLLNSYHFSVVMGFVMFIFTWVELSNHQYKWRNLVLKFMGCFCLVFTPALPFCVIWYIQTLTDQTQCFAVEYAKGYFGEDAVAWMIEVYENVKSFTQESRDTKPPTIAETQAKLLYNATYDSSLCILMSSIGFVVCMWLCHLVVMACRQNRRWNVWIARGVLLFVCVSVIVITAAKSFDSANESWISWFGRLCQIVKEPLFPVNDSQEVYTKTNIIKMIVSGLQSACIRVGTVVYEKANTSNIKLSLQLGSVTCFVLLLTMVFQGNAYFVFKTWSIVVQPFVWQLEMLFLTYMQAVMVQIIQIAFKLKPVRDR